jgi:hypothetical protein
MMAEDPKAPKARAGKSDSLSAWFKKGNNKYIAAGAVAVAGYAYYKKTHSSSSTSADAGAAATTATTTSSGGGGRGFQSEGNPSSSDFMTAIGTLTTDQATANQGLAAIQSSLNSDTAALQQLDSTMTALQADVAALKTTPDKKSGSSSGDGSVSTALPDSKTASNAVEENEKSPGSRAEGGAVKPTATAQTGDKAKTDKLLSDTTAANTAGKGKTEMHTDGTEKTTVDKPKPVAAAAPRKAGAKPTSKPVAAKKAS